MLRAMVLVCLAACAPAGALLDPAGAQRRGAVELAVKSAYPGILREIEAGGGPALTRALDAAAVPGGDRTARVTQLSGDLGLFEANPAALVTALLVFGA